MGFKILALDAPSSVARPKFPGYIGALLMSAFTNFSSSSSLKCPELCFWERRQWPQRK